MRFWADFFMLASRIERVHPKKAMDHAALRSDLRSQKS